MNLSDKAALYMQAWRDDWCKFCSDVLKARLDKEQQDIMKVCQNAPLLSFTHKAPTFTSWGFVIT